MQCLGSGGAQVAAEDHVPAVEHDGKASELHAALRRKAQPLREVVARRVALQLLRRLPAHRGKGLGTRLAGRPDVLDLHEERVLHAWVAQEVRLEQKVRVPAVRLVLVADEVRAHRAPQIGYHRRLDELLALDLVAHRHRLADARGENVHHRLPLALLGERRQRLRQVEYAGIDVPDLAIGRGHERAHEAPDRLVRDGEVHERPSAAANRQHSEVVEKRDEVLLVRHVPRLEGVNEVRDPAPVLDDALQKREVAVQPAPDRH